MFTESSKTILEFLKLSPRYIFALVFLTGFLLLAPEDTLNRLGVLDFTQNNRFWLGITFVASMALVCAGIGADLLDRAKKFYLQRKKVQRIKQRLHTLTEEEKQILRFYIVKQTRANTLRIEDGIVQQLANERIIYRSADIGNLNEGFAYNIVDIAWEYLNLNPHLLNGNTMTHRTDKRDENWW